MSNRTINLSDDLYDYLLAHSVKKDAVLEALREETGKLPHGLMQISPEQGQFMTLLVRLMGVRKAIEVGVFTGYSSLCVARGLEPDGRLIACDVSEEWTSIARRYWDKAGLSDRIELRLAPAGDTLNQLLADGYAGEFDFAFIDADKSNYQNYYESCLRLLRSGGLLGVDNTLWSGAVIDPDDQSDDTSAIRALNDFIYHDDRVDSCLLPLGDGLILARKR